MRCFLALDLPPPLCNYLARISRELKKGQVRRVDADQMHITLVFAGVVDDATVADLRAAVRTVPVQPMRFALAGLGHFPPRGEPRVIWTGLSGDIDVLTELHGELTERAEIAGVPRDRRGFHAHVTLGRVRSAFGAYAIPDELEEVGPLLRDKPFEPTALTLYASELTPQGPRYSVLERRAL